MSTSNRARVASPFAELGVHDDLIELLERSGITEPFPIQRATIPDALSGRDVLGRAPTGSGKTLAFGIPMITRLDRARPHRPTGLILSPTRELAEQIRRELEPLARARGKRLLAVYGGVGFGKQLSALRQGVELLVACPGRLQDLVDQEHVSLEAVTTVVIDEADRMADMGFLPAVKSLVDTTSPDRQTLMFSATLGPEVQKLTDRYQTNPARHEIGDNEPDLSLVTHRFIRTDRHQKVPIAAHIIAEAGATIVFCRTRYGVDRVARQLKNAGIKTSLIHGKRTQNQRDNALDAFIKGKVTALVATDVASRGIHVDNVACVIHFDPPDEQAAYVHRSGRTARVGAGGAVVSLVNSDQLKDVRRIQKALRLPDRIEDTPDVPNRDASAPNANGQNAPSAWVEHRGQRPKSKSRNRNRRSGTDNRSGSSGGSHSKSSGSKPSPSRSSKPPSSKRNRRGAAGGSGPRSQRSNSGHGRRSSGGRSGSNR